MTRRGRCPPARASDRSRDGALDVASRSSTRLRDLAPSQVWEFARLSAEESAHDREVHERHWPARMIISATELLEVPDEEWDCAASREMRRLAHALDEPALIELTALMWYGRGDGPLVYCRKHATKTSHGAGEVDYVLGKPLFRYLPRAMIKLGYSRC